MNQFAMTNRKEGPGSKSSRKSRVTDSAFDKWLNRGLHELFDDVMKEPIPPQFLDILQSANSGDGAAKPPSRGIDKRKKDDNGQ